MLAAGGRRGLGRRRQEQSPREDQGVHHFHLARGCRRFRRRRAPRSPGVRRLPPLALILLLAVYTVNFLDRQIVSILAEPIKRDLHLSDTQLGLLTGLAFAIFYTFLGLPIARLAERSNRVTIIGVSLAVWSGFTVVCGLATNYTQLLLARIGVGVGEAGCTPTAHSLIADYVPKSQRASALAFFAMGTPLGSLLGSSLGGVMSDTFGWRTAFLLAGVPGLLLTAVVFLTLREPRKELSALARARMAETQKTEGSFGATLRYLARKRTFWLVAFGAATLAFIGYGNGAFVYSPVGLGAGPLIVGALSDVFATGLGLGEAEGVRWAIIVTSCCTLIAAGLFWMARKSIKEDLVS